jgi:hypothetical protein
MTSEKIVSTSFGLRESSGQRRIVHLETERRRNVSEDYQVFSLSFYTDGPEFRAATAEDAMKVLFLCPEWFNTSPQLPTWGRVDPQTLEVVRIEDVRELTSVDLPRPMLFDTVVSTTTNAQEKCEQLLGRQLLEHYSWAVRVVRVPVWQTLSMLKQQCEKKWVFIGPVASRARHFCHSVLPAEEGQVMLITSTEDFTGDRA